MRISVILTLGLVFCFGWQPLAPAATIPAPASSDTGESLGKGLERALSLEEEGDFAKAIRVCGDLATRFGNDPGVEKARELSQRLTQERRDSAQLLFAVELLGTKEAAKVNVAKTVLAEAGDLGAILLRRAVRTANAETAVVAIDVLEGMGDPKAAVAYASRLQIETNELLTAALVRVCRERIRLADGPARMVLAGSLGGMVDAVTNDPAFAHRNMADLVLLALANWHEGKAEPFERALGRNGAVASLREYVNRAWKSSDPDISNWACTQLGVVGLENTKGLVAWWRLDDRSGTVARDSSGHDLRGTLVNAPVWGDGVIGGALGFNGSNACVRNADALFPAITNTFTMMLWVRPVAARLEVPESNGLEATGVNGQRYAIFPDHGSPYGPGHAGAGLSIGTNGISVHEHGEGYLPALLVYPAAVTGWTHVAVVYENAKPALYVNGILAKQGLPSTRIVHPSASLGEIGNCYGYFEGWVDDVRIYDRVLSASEIAGIAKLVAAFPGQ